MATAGVITVAALGGSAWLITCQGQKGSGSGIAVAAEPERDEADTVSVRMAEIVVPLVIEEAAPVRRRPTQPVARRSKPETTTVSIEPRASEQTRRSLPGRVARLIVGDGRHEVRPFPTVPDRHP